MVACVGGWGGPSYGELGSEWMLVVVWGQKLLQRSGWWWEGGSVTMQQQSVNRSKEDGKRSYPEVMVASTMKADSQMLPLQLEEWAQPFWLVWSGLGPLDCDIFVVRTFFGKKKHMSAAATQKLFLLGSRGGMN